MTDYVLPEFLAALLNKKLPMEYVLLSDTIKSMKVVKSNPI